MREIKLKTSKGTKKLHIAERLDELTLEQTIKIEQNPETDPLQIFCILTGLDLAMGDNLGPELEEAILDVIYPIFQSRVEFTDLTQHPSHLLVGKKLVKIPDPAKVTLGQNIMFMQTAEKAENIYAAIPELLSIFLQPEYSGGIFDRHKIPEVKKELLGSIGVEALAVFGFFLSDAKNWRRIFPVVCSREKLKQVRLSVIMKRRFLADSTG